jgi:NTE family protein
MAISEGGLRSNTIERRGLISLGLASLATPLFACASRAEPESGSDALAPVGQPGDLSDLREPGAPPEAGIGLCLSGGGYRAMLFHVGALWRLYESDLLKQAKRISSVSGGSITAGLLGLKWSRLPEDPTVGRPDFEREVVDPIRGLASHTLDRSAIFIGGILPGTSIADRVVEAYEEHLFGDATLQDLPDEPRFVINATNVQTGALWRFSKAYMADYQVGMVEHPTVRLAVAVAASSAFPPVLSPLRLELEPSAFKPGSGDGLQKRPYTEEAVLTDGGVYDNLGLETVWKRYDTVLVSDAGGKLQPEAEPATDWGRHVVRVLDVIDNQVRSLRKRQLIDSFDSGIRKGTYWGIRTDIAEYELPDALPAPYERTLQLAEVPTRLERMPPRLQEQLINWGYAVCDAAVRRHVTPDLKAGAFPYPGSTV